MSESNDEQQRQKMQQRESQKDSKIFTDICLEQPTDFNPYLAEKRYLKGYDIEHCVAHISPVDVLFLQYSGELPDSVAKRKILEMLMVYLAMPSPRESSSRAAMACGVSKTNAEHLLPIALMSAGGERSGALEVEASYKFITEHIEKCPVDVAKEHINRWQEDDHTHPCPGFGQLYQDIDPITAGIFASLCQTLPQGESLNWVKSFVAELNQYNVGILEIGLAACVFHQLNFRHRESVGLYQLLKAPGLLAYGMEQTHKPVSTMPMLEDSQYELKK